MRVAAAKINDYLFVRQRYTAFLPTIFTTSDLVVMPIRCGVAASIRLRQRLRGRRLPSAMTMSPRLKTCRPASNYVPPLCGVASSTYFHLGS
jgi:hypothetical protein